MARSADVYRGVLVRKIKGQDKYGGVIDAVQYIYLKPYDKPGPAKASVTTARKEWGNQLEDAYVEVSAKWTRIN